MPSFCRHNHLIQNCPICAREQQVQLRPVVSPGSARPRATGGGGSGTVGGAGRSGTAVRPSASRSGGRGGSGLTVRKLVRGADDGYRCELVPGLKSGHDAARLAEELAFAATRLQVLGADPPGLYAELAHGGANLEERTWLAFLIAYLGPLEGNDPFAEVQRVRTTWSSGALPELAGVRTGPAGSAEPGQGARTLEAYHAWAQRAGSQAGAFTGEAAWTPERRFARVFERLALPGLHRGVRFDLLVTLGRLGVYELQGATLALGGSDPVTIAAKRLLGIGDSMLLERRSADLAAACQIPLEALDAGFFNWERGTRVAYGLDPATLPDPEILAGASTALGL